MAPFRWPLVQNDIDLAIEVDAARPEKSSDWDLIAAKLSNHFSTPEKPVELTGRSCRERMDRVLEKYKFEESRSLKRSGTEDNFTELKQLCEDIVTFRRDFAAARQKEKESKKNKEERDKKAGEEMRRAAMEGMARRRRGSDGSGLSSTSLENLDEDVSSDKESPKKGKGCKKRRVGKLSAVEMLAEKYDQKAILKEKEIELKKMELQFQVQKFEQESEERKLRLELEMQERRAMLDIVNKMK
ncbi:MAP7 domain-containing protein 2-like [Montipora capricornis]|uniref:MAP7 domain-containing protein 2-like n=1 Tax=Montipora capricornis TaxID=246305 RepID=UPI0035F16D1D